MSDEQTTNDDSPVWRRGNLYAVRSAGCADGFEVWHKYGNSSIPVSLGKDVTSLRALLTDLEEAGEDEAWRARTIGGSSMDGSNTNDDLNDHAVERAQRSDAERISEECDALKAMLLEKNKAYGSSALSPVRIFSKADTVEQIRVRLDDKLSRLMRGSAAGEDVVKDLLGYLILLRIAQREQHEKDVHVAASPEVIEEVLTFAGPITCLICGEAFDDAETFAAHRSSPHGAAREDVGFALTDAESAEAERAVDAYVAKKRPAGREHLPTSYELDRAESIAQRLREENRALEGKLAQERETGEELRAEAKLARIHRDGGHHTEEVGLARSVYDADKRVALLNAERADRAEPGDESWGLVVRHKLAIARGLLEGLLEEKEEGKTGEFTAEQIRQVLNETADPERRYDAVAGALSWLWSVYPQSRGDVRKQMRTAMLLLGRGPDEDESGYEPADRAIELEQACEELRAEAKRAWSHLEEIAKALGCGTSQVQILMALTKTMADATRETEEARNGRDEAIRQRDALRIERDALAADNRALLARDRGDRPNT